MWGSALGPVLAGYIFDQTQSYSSVLWGLVATLSSSALLTSLLIKSWSVTSAALREEASTIIGQPSQH
jgi:cyanate permease